MAWPRQSQHPAASAGASCRACLITRLLWGGMWPDAHLDTLEQLKNKLILFAPSVFGSQCSDSAMSPSLLAVFWDDLHIAFNNDAGFANASTGKTAGYILAFTDSKLSQDHAKHWSPFWWRPHKMSHVSASTLAIKTQSFANASGISEWMR